MSQRISLRLFCLAFLCSVGLSSSMCLQAAEEPAKSKILRLQVVDPSGAPLEGATLTRNVLSDQKNFRQLEKFKTSPEGFAEVTLPEIMRSLQLWVRKNGYVTLYARWSDSAVEDVPQKLRVVMTPATTIGGIIVNAEDEPIPNAGVEARLADDEEQLNIEPPFRYTFGDDTKTDEQGKWSISSAPPGDELKFSLKIRHPEYIQDEYFDELAAKNGITSRQLREQTARIVMPRGEIVRGKLVTTEGDPVPFATLSWSRHARWQMWDDDKLTSKQDGSFELPAMTPGTLYLAVAAYNQKPKVEQIEVVPEMPPVKVVVEPGNRLQVKVVDPEGNPIPTVRVIIDEWNGISSAILGNQLKLFDGMTPELSDEEGNFLWDSAPEEPVKLRFSKKDWSSSTVELTPSDGASDVVQEVTLHRAVEISGKILDDETGEPIKRATMVKVLHYPNDTYVQRSAIRVLEKGEFSHTEAGGFGGSQAGLQFEALGYRPRRIGPFDSTEGSVTHDIRLERAAPLRGRVLGIDGEPFAGATVALVMKDTPLLVNDWRYDSDGLSTRTDNEGRFEFPATLHPPVIIATHESGYAEVALKLDEQPGDMQLQPWSRVEGRLVRHGKPIVGEGITLRPIRMLGGENPYVQDSFSAMTDGDGRFVFERVPPIPSSLYPYVSVWEETRLTSGEQVPLDLQPGETHTVRLGQQGVVVRGRVSPGGELASKIDMSYCLNYLLKRAPGIDPPAPIAQAGFDWQNGWSFDFHDSQEGRGFLATLPHHIVKFQSDGTFTIHGVTEGEYQFAISVYEPPEGCLIDPVGRDVINFEVTPADVEKGDLDLGEISVETKLGAQLGDPFPNFRYEGMAEDEVHTMSEWRGKYVLVDFWATWCGPCIALLPELNEVAKDLDPQRATVLSVSLDENLQQARSFIESKQMNWPQALLGERDSPVTRQQLGISSVPIYFVIDSEGKLIHRSFQLKDAVAALEKALEAG